MAVGNVFGSNCFNLATFVVLDLVHGTAPVLSISDPSLSVAALFATLVMGLAIVEVLNESERRVWIFEPGPAFMVLVYLVGLLAVSAASAAH
jgi:Ca2+/Na+ antiporter